MQIDTLGVVRGFPLDNEASRAALPQVPEAVTGEWLTHVVQRTVPGVTATGVDDARVAAA